VNTGVGGEEDLVSHISHALPGQSSVTIIQSFRRPATSNHPHSLTLPFSSAAVQIPQNYDHNSPFQNHRSPKSFETSHQNDRLYPYAQVIVNPYQTSSLADFQQESFADFLASPKVHRYRVDSHNSTHIPEYGYQQSAWSNIPTSVSDYDSQFYSSVGQNHGYLDTPTEGLTHQQNGVYAVFGQQEPNYHLSPLDQMDDFILKPVAEEYTQGTFGGNGQGVPGPFDNKDKPTSMEDEEAIPGPFAPRFQVGKREVSESEARQEISKGFQKSGLYPDFLPELPGMLVNINFGLHGCVHLGTHLHPSHTIQRPSRVTFPAGTKSGLDGRPSLQTLVLVDAEYHILHWLIANIPNGQTNHGDEVTVFQPPGSGLYGSSDIGRHHYVALVMDQTAVIGVDVLDAYRSGLCDWTGRYNFDVSGFMQKFGLKLVAGNFFTTDHEPGVAREVCSVNFL